MFSRTVLRGPAVKSTVESNVIIDSKLLPFLLFFSLSLTDSALFPVLSFCLSGSLTSGGILYPHPLHARAHAVPNFRPTAVYSVQLCTYWSSTDPLSFLCATTWSL